MIQLRYYQEEAVASVWEWFNNGGHAPLIVTPTGSGKSIILAEIIRQAISWYPETKIAVVTHVKELVVQDFEKVRLLCPNISAGIYSAGLNKRQIKQVTVASIQSVYKNEHFHGYFDIIIVDEAHLIPHKSDGMYRGLLEAASKKNEDLKLIGLTATPYRLDSGVLHKGDGALFDGISYEANLGRLIEEGYLCPLTSNIGDNTNLDGVKITAGEYNLGQLSERMSAIELVHHHAQVILERCKNRKSLLVFSVTVEHARKITEELRNCGISADYVSGEMSNKDRDEKIDAFKRGEMRALVNCAILTTGFDHPAIDCVVLLRPTMSAGLYVQMVGRGLRKHESKENCLILDFGGNVKRHGFIDQIEVKDESGARKKGEQKAPVKECPDCHAACPINLKACEACGFVFPVPERQSEKNHHVGAILSTQVKPEWINVDDASYSRHQGREGKRDTLRVDYKCGMIRVSEWVCVEHDGWARAKAEAWFRRSLKHGNQIPRTINEAIHLTGIEQINTPSRILVAFTGKFPEIKAYDFSKPMLTQQQHTDTVIETDDVPF